jgi:hypothetical protein
MRGATRTCIAVLVQPAGGFVRSIAMAFLVPQHNSLSPEKNVPNLVRAHLGSQLFQLLSSHCYLASSWPRYIQAVPNLAVELETLTLSRSDVLSG